MGYINTTFLGKEYSIPQDVLTYIDLLDFTDSVQKQLTAAFVRKLRDELAKDNLGLLGNEDLSSDFEQQIGRFIAKLCDNGIFTRTISDYLKNNKGYQLCSDVNKAALEKMKSLLIQEMDAWQAGYEDAVNKAESHVTGMGFSIWSGSFVNHAIYAAMEASTLNKQSKEAESQYKRDMEDLRSRLDAKYGGEKCSYINDTYIPNMEAALTVFAYELLDKYVSDLIANGKFDGKAMDYVDIGRSNDLLKNLTLSNNKKAILANAFVACPYNIAVYMQAMKYDLLDYSSFQTAKVFEQSAMILSFLQNNWGQVSYPTAFNIDYHCTELLALFTDTTPTEVLRSRTEKYVTDIASAYAELANLISDMKACLKVIRKYGDQEILAGYALARATACGLIERIVRPEIWDKLTITCGHSDLFDRIKAQIPGSESAGSKRDLDYLLEEKLYPILEEARRNCEAKIIAKHEDDKRRKAEADRILAEKKAKREDSIRKAKRIAAIIGIICCVAIVVIVSFKMLNRYIIAPSTDYDTAIALMEDGKYQEAYGILTSLDGFKNSEKLIKECLSTVFDENIVQLIIEEKYGEAYSALISVGNAEHLKYFKVAYTKSSYSDKYYTSSSSYTYDDLGNLLEVIETYEDGDKETTEYIYDEKNRLISVINTDSDIFKTTYTYGLDDRLLEEISEYNGESYTYTYSYDANGNMVEKTYTTSDDHWGKTTKYEYNSNGQVRKELNHDGTYTYYEYGSRNELLKEVYVWSDGHESIDSFWYDNNGLLIKETDSYGNSIVYSYDSNYWLIKKTEYDDGQFYRTTEYDDHVVFFSFAD